MIDTAIIIAIVAGCFLGGFAVWLVLRGRIYHAAAQTRAQFDLQIAVLNERVADRDKEIAELRSASEEQKRLGAQLDSQLRAQLHAEATTRAAVEEKAKRVPQLEDQLSSKDGVIREFQNQITDLKTGRSELETTLAKERTAFQEKIALLNEAQTKLSDAFKALSAEALKSNNQSFLELAKSTLEKFQETARGDLDKRQQAIDQLVKPVAESLKAFDSKVQDLEKSRVDAYAGLSQQVKALVETQTQLRSEAAKLVRALGTPRVRGRWGEIQLKRVVEMAGMLDHCDFYEQQSVATEEGLLRPDLVVRLPGGKNIVVDAKAPLSAYLEANEANDEPTRREKLRDHARQIRDHMTALSRKSYWEQFQPAPELVVLFLPGETFFSAALEQDPVLIEQGVEQKVFLATPITLITMLKAVAYGWRQEKLAANAKEISDLGKELYKRIADMGGHFGDVGSKLGKAVESYNKAVGSLESRVLVSARKFRELETTGTEEEIAPALPVETAPRQPQAPEMMLLPDESAQDENG